MGRVKEPQSVKFFCGIIASDRGKLRQAEEALETSFGQTDLKSDLIDFNYTNYYESEMGTGLIRRFISFSELKNPSELAPMKLRTNSLEQQFAGESGRTVNLDPGYIAPSKLILASAKDFSHRIYLGQGIYGEVTLNFRRGGYKFFEWTYPDFQSRKYCSFFLEVREKLMEQTK